MQVRYNGKQVYAQRLAVLLMTGSWPADGLQVDHINGDRGDNRWENLRVVENRVNSENQRQAHSHSSSGLLGAHWFRPRNKWRARIQVKGKFIHLGYFNTAEEAHQVYLNAKRELHEGCMI